MEKNQSERQFQNDLEQYNMDNVVNAPKTMYTVSVMNHQRETRLTKTILPKNKRIKSINE